ncbi:MAG: hypothetical protein IPO63_03165 [Bacteroidetes bacterium]|nr:hypothetical protein [Bacteroidota bacterium]
MITENEVSDLLGKELPEINLELDKLSNSSNIYKAMRCFVDYTKQLILKGNINETKLCFILAERMLIEGNNSVRNAIENVYVYSLGTFIDLADSTANRAKEIFNGLLKKEYNRQLMASGI